FHDAALASQVRSATERWMTRRLAEVAGFIKMLAEDPEAAVRGLNQTSQGIEWLVERMRMHRDTLALGKGLIAAEQAEVVRLLGQRPDDPRDLADPRDRDFLKALAA